MGNQTSKIISRYSFLLGVFLTLLFGSIFIVIFLPLKQKPPQTTKETLQIYRFELGKDPNDFIGEWVSSDTSNSGIVKLLIERAGEDFSVKAWGACHPTPCEWSKTKFYLLGDSVASKTFNKGSAHWDHNFKDVYVLIQFEGLASVYYTQLIEGKDEKLRKEVPQIKLTSISIFKDNSGRVNYQKSALLHKENLADINKALNKTPEVTQRAN